MIAPELGIIHLCSLETLLQRFCSASVTHHLSLTRNIPPSVGYLLFLASKASKPSATWEALILLSRWTWQNTRRRLGTNCQVCQMFARTSQKGEFFQNTCQGFAESHTRGQGSYPVYLNALARAVLQPPPA